MTISLKYKLLLLTIIPLSVVLVVIGGLTVQNKRSTEQELLANRMDAYRILLESGDASFETATDKEKLEALFNETVEFSEILNKDYKPLYSSENSAIAMINENDKKDVDDAFNGITTTKKVEKSEKRNEAFVTISPLVVNGRVVAVLHQALSNEKSDARIFQYTLQVGSFILGGILACLILVFFLSKQVILKNIYTLEQGALKIEKGILDSKINVKTNDEIGLLAKTFDAMRLAVKSQKKQLEDYSKTLEKKVQERTKKLQESNDALESFNRLAVGRELKMIEMKEELKRIKATNSSIPLKERYKITL